MTRFFKNFPAAQKTWPKQGPFTALEELENQFGRAKKKVIKIFENFLKIRPPRKNPRSAPVFRKKAVSHKHFKKIMLAGCSLLAKLAGAPLRPG